MGNSAPRVLPHDDYTWPDPQAGDSCVVCLDAPATVCLPCSNDKQRARATLSVACGITACCAPRV